MLAGIAAWIKKSAAEAGIHHKARYIELLKIFKVVWIPASAGMT
ncbi:hypothetical protein [Rickettsia felis]|nr:hypothetical protein [Rickettsia felis]